MSARKRTAKKAPAKRAPAKKAAAKKTTPKAVAATKPQAWPDFPYIEPLPDHYGDLVGEMGFDPARDGGPLDDQP